jgi:hypothetical protein
MGIVSVPVGLKVLALGRPRVVVESGSILAGADPCVKIPIVTVIDKKTGGIWRYIEDNGNTRPFTVYVGEKGMANFEKTCEGLYKYYKNSKDYKNGKAV